MKYLKGVAYNRLSTEREILGANIIHVTISPFPFPVAGIIIIIIII